MFAEDHNGRFPPQLSITNGGSRELIPSNSPALHLRTLSNYLVRNWRVLRCPADEAKQPLTNSAVLTDRNVSYFISVDATQGMYHAFQAGDRNLEAGGQPVKPGLFILTTNAALAWTWQLHTKQAGRPTGNILFVDGHVQNFRTSLTAAVEHQGLDSNRLAVP